MPLIANVVRLLQLRNPQIICIQERWLHKSIADTLVSIRNYATLLSDRIHLSGYGGVIICIRRDVEYVQLNVAIHDTHEGILVAVTSTRPDLTIANVHRPPGLNSGSFLKCVETFLTDMRHFVMRAYFNIYRRCSNACQCSVSRNN
jgi:exonuclease III